MRASFFYTFMLWRKAKEILEPDNRLPISCDERRNSVYLGSCVEIFILLNNSACAEPKPFGDANHLGANCANGPILLSHPTHWHEGTYPADLSLFFNDSFNTLFDWADELVMAPYTANLARANGCPIPLFIRPTRHQWIPRRTSQNKA